MAEVEYTILCKIGKVFVANNISRKYIGTGIDALRELIAKLSEGRTKPIDINSILQHYEEKVSQFETLHTFDICIMLDNDTFFSLPYETEGEYILRNFIMDMPVPDVIIHDAVIDVPRVPEPPYRSKLYAYDKRRNYSKKNYWNRIRSRLF